MFYRRGKGEGGRGSGCCNRDNSGAIVVGRSLVSAYPCKCGDGATCRVHDGHRAAFWQWWCDTNLLSWSTNLDLLLRLDNSCGG